MLVMSSLSLRWRSSLRSLMPWASVRRTPVFVLCLYLPLRPPYFSYLVFSPLNFSPGKSFPRIITILSGVGTQRASLNLSERNPYNVVCMFSPKSFGMSCIYMKYMCLAARIIARLFLLKHPKLRNAQLSYAGGVERATSGMWFFCTLWHCTKYPPRR